MPVDPMMKYDPVLTINIAMSEGNFEFPEGEDYQHNDMYDLFEDTMGIHFNNIIQAPANAMKEKMQMAIATNDIPDMASVDATMLRTLINNDMIEDMTDIYNTWASDNLKEVTGQSDNALFAPTLKDGRYMAIPRANTVADLIPILFIRSDWLEKLGLSEPKTVEEMFEIAEAFATHDPDGNGVADTYGLQMDKDL
ncbi:extracellular solute-binding protein, partial [uncultured Bifidobacterium sp.]|uniref:extracellular solute-binding protein n=1 Tax=uncultured Bifidobacterium sp. TaxID=165187 RepID=UPI00259957B0